MKTCVCVCVRGGEEEKGEEEEEEEREEEEEEEREREEIVNCWKENSTISIISVSSNVPSPCLSPASSSPGSPHSPTVSHTPWHLSPPPPLSLPSLCLLLLLLQSSQILGSKQSEGGVVYKGYLEIDRIACYEKWVGLHGSLVYI